MTNAHWNHRRCSIQGIGRGVRSRNVRWETKALLGNVESDSVICAILGSDPEMWSLPNMFPSALTHCQATMTRLKNGLRISTTVATMLHKYSRFKPLNLQLLPTLRRHRRRSVYIRALLAEKNSIPYLPLWAHVCILACRHYLFLVPLEAQTSLYIIPGFVPLPFFM
jgi:hypothetical protein